MTRREKIARVIAPEKTLRSNLIQEIMMADSFLDRMDIFGVHRYGMDHVIRDYRIRDGSQIVYSITQRYDNKAEYQRCHELAMIKLQRLEAGVRADRLLQAFDIKEKE